jgi:hypothetical protein
MFFVGIGIDMFCALAMAGNATIASEIKLARKICA